MVLPTAEMKQATGRNPEAGLLSREATAAVGSAFSTLTETVKKHEPTLENVVRETLHPMLKSWLDENLPRLVEQMVQAEIERVTRGRYVFLLHGAASPRFLFLSRVRAEPGNARCRFYGGKSTGPKTQAGRARIAEAQQLRWRTYQASGG
jgi:hypothetical protein